MATKAAAVGKLPVQVPQEEHNGFHAAESLVGESGDADSGAADSSESQQLHVADTGVGNGVSGDAADAAQDAEAEEEVLEGGAAAGNKLRVIQSILHRLQLASATVHSQPQVLCPRSLYCMQCPTMT
jgi:hypothetical protein